MDENVRKIMDIKLERTKKALEKNNMNALILNNVDEVVSYFKNTVEADSRLSVGGSQTLFEAGLIDLFREMPIHFEDRYEEGITREQQHEIFRQAFTCDYYVTSSNAVSENGELYNIDGTGNRVAAMTYGPKKVIVVVGENKLVASLPDAMKRLETTAAPMNAQRLERKTPCTITGTCSECYSEERICSTYAVTKRQTTPNKGRITVLLVKENLGY